MKNTLWLMLGALMLSSISYAEDTLISPQELKWNTTESKNQVAQVTQNELYNTRTVRLRIPANSKLQPHGVNEGYMLVTVISGTLQLGFGTTWDDAKLQTLKPGSVFSQQGPDKHFAQTGNEPVTLQVTIIRPKSITADTH